MGINKMNKYLEMWKVNKVGGWLDCVFDTCFVAFLWIMGWKVIFWVYLVIGVLSIIGNAIRIKRLEDKI